ncbi:MAG: hypothetical protein AB9861_02175 [Methanosarcina sp.]
MYSSPEPPEPSLDWIGSYDISGEILFIGRNDCDLTQYGKTSVLCEVSGIYMTFSRKTFKADILLGKEG